MNKRIQVIISDQALAKLEKVFHDATHDFQVGTISLADLISEMILVSDVDIKELRAKHTNLKKSLLMLAKDKDLDIETALKTLQELKNKNTKKQSKNANSSEHDV